MTGRKNKGHPEWENLTRDELNQMFDKTDSQCKLCEHKVGTKGCKVFKERPYKYMSVSANVPCPERKVR